MEKHVEPIKAMKKRVINLRYQLRRYQENMSGENSSELPRRMIEGMQAEIESFEWGIKILEEKVRKNSTAQESPA